MSEPETYYPPHDGYNTDAQIRLTQTHWSEISRGKKIIVYASDGHPIEVGLTEPCTGWLKWMCAGLYWYVTRI